MTDIRELLELAAKAIGSLEIGRWANVPGRTIAVMETEDFWAPHEDSGDCADMCAALGIDTTWYGASVDCDGPDAGWTELYASHNNDRAAAWRMAALRVAAEIGRAKS